VLLTALVVVIGGSATGAVALGGADGDAQDLSTASASEPPLEDADRSGPDGVAGGTSRAELSSPSVLPEVTLDSVGVSAGQGDAPQTREEAARRGVEEGARLAQSQGANVTQEQITDSSATGAPITPS